MEKTNNSIFTRRQFVKTSSLAALGAPILMRFPVSELDTMELNLIKHMDLGGMNLMGCLNPEKNYLPYWHMIVDANQNAEYQYRPYCNGHNIGRWWNAMLRLEGCTGFKIPKKVEAAMLENSKQHSDNLTGIFLDNPQMSNVETWYIHSYRETMLSLGLLVKYKDNDWAYQKGILAIRQMSEASQDLNFFDFALCNKKSANLKLSVSKKTTYTHGRAIEGLLNFYEATGSAEALKEIERLAEFHFQYTINSDGSLASRCGNHTHSYLNTIRGLLLYALMKGQKDRLDIILATYRNAISQMITRSGYVSHDIGTGRISGDIASAGDIAHIALLLWDYFKDPALLDDAERIVRCRLIPSQIINTIPLNPMSGKSGDSVRDLPQRFVGAIGGEVGHVKGQTCTTDFTASALHSLIELYQRAVDIKDSFIRVNFHFSCEHPGFKLKCVRSMKGASVEIWNNTGKDIYIRIPAWVNDSSLQFLVNKKQIEVTKQNGFAFIPSKGVKTHVLLNFSLPEYQIKEVWQDKFATQEFVTFHWRGDEITKVEPVGRYFEPFAKELGSFL